MLQLWLKRRQLAKLDEHLYMLRDQVASGQAAIARYEAERAELQARIWAAERSRNLLKGVTA